jgi:tetratricopeptide (TPR) repeat protein
VIDSAIADSKDEARQFGWQNKPEKALEIMRDVKLRYPDVEFTPEVEVANILKVIGEDMASRGNVDEALVDLRKAMELDPSLDLIPEFEVAKILVSMRGDAEEALSLMRKAKELAPNPDLNPEVEVAKMLIVRALDLAWSGNYEVAVKAYADAKKYAPLLDLSAIDRSADEWNELCWFSSLYGHAAEVLDACEQAVALAPEHGGIRDSRGLAKALTGDFEGAIEDFKYYVEWAKNDLRPEDERLKRVEWISALEAGKNPFDQATLEILRKGY